MFYYNDDQLDHGRDYILVRILDSSNGKIIKIKPTAHEFTERGEAYIRHENYGIGIRVRPGPTVVNVDGFVAQRLDDDQFRDAVRVAQRNFGALLENIVQAKLMLGMTSNNITPVGNYEKIAAKVYNEAFKSVPQPQELLLLLDS